MIVHVEKENQEAPICVDGKGDDNSLHRLCSHFGYG